MKYLALKSLSSCAATLAMSFACIGEVRWLPLAPQAAIAERQTWSNGSATIKFTAVRAHLGYYRLSLVDIAQYASKHSKELISNADNSKYLGSPQTVGLSSIFRTWTDSQLLAVAPAGWSGSLRWPQQVGQLKIDGRELTEEDADRRSLSAFLCLNSPRFADQKYDYQIPVIFNLQDNRRHEKLSACKDIVQVGPRIIEDPNINEGPGISPEEKSLPSSVRVIFAVDAPDRGKINNKTRDAARNVYLIITENKVHLYDIQTMLLSRDFYGDDKISYWWAVNLAGGNAGGLVIKGPDAPLVFGNGAGTVGSVIAISGR